MENKMESTIENILYRGCIEIKEIRRKLLFRV